MMKIYKEELKEVAFQAINFSNSKITYDINQKLEEFSNSPEIINSHPEATISFEIFSLRIKHIIKRHLDALLVNIIKEIQLIDYKESPLYSKTENKAKS